MFTTPYTAGQVASGYITFTMRGDVVLDIPVSDDSVVISDNAISLTLTQQQTLSFQSKATSLVQLRLVLDDGSVVASNIIKITIGDILKDGEI